MTVFSSFANTKFWKEYNSLPNNIQDLADKAYQLFKENPNHPSLHFKKVGNKQPIYSVRINDDFRALGYKIDNNIYWFWIGNHDNYDKLISSF